ncbi:MAG: ABC transporter substrate-binding protein [Myxococcota bacterium]|jgi:branched-chain amino acid transport system substrate-binding protein|nr:ABC transporter substrate-binding protein [Myxococcota bacterium]
MMLSSRRLFVSVLLAGLGTALFGCKKKEGAEAGSSGASAASKPIVIGHYASMTGSTAHYGQDTDKAVRLAIEEVNRQGGVNGRKLEVVTLDDRGDSAEASNAVARLIDVEKASAIIGEVASSLSLSGGRVAQRRKVPMVSPSSTNPKVTEVGDYIFRVCFLDPFQGKVMANFARNTLKLDSVAILKDVKNDYSIGLADAFRAAFTGAGGKIAVEQSYSQGDTDFSAQITAIKGSGAQAIFTPGYYSEVGSIARTAQRLGVKVPLLGGDGWDAPDLVKIGGDALEGSYFSNHFAPDVATPKAQKFVADFKAKYKQEPTGLGALGYDAAAVIIEAMRHAPDLSGDAIRSALGKIKDFEGVSGKITINGERNADKSAVVLKIVDGKYKYETTVEP